LLQAHTGLALLGAVGQEQSKAEIKKQPNEIPAAAVRRYDGELRKQKAASRFFASSYSCSLLLVP